MGDKMGTMEENNNRCRVCRRRAQPQFLSEDKVCDECGKSEDVNEVVAENVEDSLPPVRGAFHAFDGLVIGESEEQLPISDGDMEAAAMIARVVRDALATCSYRLARSHNPIRDTSVLQVRFLTRSVLADAFDKVKPLVSPIEVEIEEFAVKVPAARLYFFLEEGTPSLGVI